MTGRDTTARGTAGAAAWIQGARYRRLNNTRDRRGNLNSDHLGLVRHRVVFHGDRGGGVVVRPAPEG